MLEGHPAAPAWLHPVTLGAMEAAREVVLAWGRDALAAAEAAREVALAHYPALPLPMIADAVAALVPDPRGLGTTTRGSGAAPLSALAPVAGKEVAQSFPYALRFEDRGKSRRSGSEFLAPFAAGRPMQRLTLSGFVGF